MKSLKKSINDFISFLKKRYQLIPWSQIQKVHKIDFDEDTRITVGEKEYSVDELLKKIKETQSSLRSKQKMSYFHHYVKEFLQDSKSKMSIDVKKIYTEYDDKLDTEFKDTKYELMFCLNSLKEINKTLKSREIKESMEEIELMNNQYFTEGLINSERDIFYNRKKYEEGEINICFILGYSGSGKSTISKAEHKYAREVVDMDRIILYRNKPDSYYRNMGPFAVSFMNGPGKKYRTTETEEEVKVNTANNTYRKNISRDLVKFARKYAKINSRIKLVLEGVYLYRYMEPQEVKDCAVYIKGTSLLTATQRAIKRDTADPGKIRKGDEQDFHNDGKKKSNLQKLGHAGIKYFMAAKDALFRALIHWQNYYWPLYEKQINHELETKTDEPDKKKAFKNHVKRSIHDIKGNFKKESEDSTMDYFNLELFKEGFSKSDIQDMMIDAYESFFNDDDFFDDIDVVEEGANIEYMKKIKSSKKLFRTAVKDYKAALKVNDFARAKKDLKDMDNILEDTKKEIEENADTIPQKYIGTWLAAIITFGKGLLLLALGLVPIVGNIGAPIIAIRGAIVEAEELAQGRKTLAKDSLKNDDMKDMTASSNLLKTKAVGIITNYQRKLKVLDQKIDQALKDRRKLERAAEKNSKVTKESVEFEEKKLMLYESCQNGDITVEEREQLISELRDDLFLSEATVDVDDSEYMSNTEKFDQIKLALYEKCNDGEITIEERESLINKAYDKIFEEECNMMPNSKGANAAGMVETKAQDAAMKSTEKAVTSAVTKAADTVAKNAEKE